MKLDFSKVPGGPAAVQRCNVRSTAKGNRPMYVVNAELEHEYGFYAISISTPSVNRAKAHQIFRRAKAVINAAKAVEGVR